jgi:hypothetical protein
MLMESKPDLRVQDTVCLRSRPISRRETVRRLLGGVVAGVAFPALAASHPIHKHLMDETALAQADAKVAASEWSPAFLDSHQNETLIVLAERIVPGAVRAQVNRFIDLLLSVDTQENQRQFISSLSAIDAEALRRFTLPFRDLVQVHQEEILMVFTTVASGESEAEKDTGGLKVPSIMPSQASRLTLRNDFEKLKGWISGAYYSSEVGMKELGWTGEVAFESFPGCEHPDGTTESAQPPGS